MVKESEKSIIVIVRWLPYIYYGYVSKFSDKGVMMVSLGSAWMLPAVLCFALMGAFVKKSGSEFGFAELVFWRTLFATVVLFLEAKWHQRTFYTPYLKEHIFRGVIGTLGIIFFFYAITHLSLATAITLNYTSPIWLAILSFLLLKERVSRPSLFALLFGFAGIILLLQPTLERGQEFAAFIGMLSGFAAGWAYLQVRELTALGEPVWKVVFSFSLISVLISGVMASFSGWHLPNIFSIWDLLAIGVFALVGQMCMTRAYKVGQKFVVASLSYLTVVLSALLGVMWFGDHLDGQEWLGMLMVALSGAAGSLYAYYIQHHKSAIKRARETADDVITKE